MLTSRHSIGPKDNLEINVSERILATMCVSNVARKIKPKALVYVSGRLKDKIKYILYKQYWRFRK